MKKTLLTLSALAVFSAGAYAQQLSGVKTINPNGSGADNYVSFNAAITALKTAGVNGAVTFNVTPGVYQERFTIDSLATVGATSTNPIIFQKDPAGTGEVFVRPNTAGTSVVNVYNASWVTLDGINLEDGGDGAGNNRTNRGMQLSGAQHCTFKNFTIRMNSRGQLINAASRGIASTSTFGSAKRTLSYNTFDNLRIVSAGNRAFSFFSDLPGSATNADLHDRKNVVTNCHIDSIGGGVSGTGTSASCLVAFFLEQDSLLFKGNRITNMLHQPTAATPLTALQVSSNLNNVLTRGPVIEDNIIGSVVSNGSPSFVEDNFTGAAVVRTLNGVFRNNVISDIEANVNSGAVCLSNSNLMFDKNKIRNLTGLTGDAEGVIIGSDSLGSTYSNNRISNIKSDADGSTTAIDVLGFDIQNTINGSVIGNTIDSIYASESSQELSPAGIRTSAAIANSGRPTGGDIYVANNFVSHIYQAVAETDPEQGTIAARGMLSANFRNASAVPSSGGSQHIYHNTIVLNRPGTTTDVSYATIGASLFARDEATDSVFFMNNILINATTHADDSDSSFVLSFGGGANLITKGNNYSNVNGTNKFAVIDTASLFPFINDWILAGNDMMTDSVAVTFVDEAAGDLHLAAADYTNARLRKSRLAWVAKDIDGTDRASSDTQVGADAQDGEQNLNPIAVKNSIKAAKSLVVFPNPTRENARFAMNVEKATTATITVRNLMGQTVATKNVNLNAGANTAGINVADLSSGIYVYSVAVNGNVFTGKFIKE